VFRVKKVIKKVILTKLWSISNEVNEITVNLYSHMSKLGVVSYTTLNIGDEIQSLAIKGMLPNGDSEISQRKTT